MFLIAYPEIVSVATVVTDQKAHNKRPAALEKALIATAGVCCDTSAPSESKSARSRPASRSPRTACSSAADRNPTESLACRDGHARTSATMIGGRSVGGRCEAEARCTHSVQRDRVDLGPVFEANLHADRVAGDFRREIELVGRRRNVCSARRIW